jgi:hypothetical protein
VSINRRRWPRLVAEGEVLGRVEELWLDLSVVDLSFGGFLAKASTPLPINEVLEVKLTTPDGSWQDIFDVRVVWCRGQAGIEGDSFLVGFAFISVSNLDGEPRIQPLVDRLARAPIADEENVVGLL